MSSKLAFPKPQGGGNAHMPMTYGRLSGGPQSLMHTMLDLMADGIVRSSLTKATCSKLLHAVMSSTFIHVIIGVIVIATILITMMPQGGGGGGTSGADTLNYRIPPAWSPENEG